MRRTTLTIVFLALGIAGFLTNAGAQFVAFDEYAGGPNSSTNATFWTILFGTNKNTGLLKNITNGLATKVTLTVQTNGTPSTSTISGVPTNASFASNVFGPYVTFGNGYYGLTTNQTVSYTLTGLDPNNLYSLKGTTIRGNTNSGIQNFNSNRWTLFELVGADNFTNAHTARCLTGDSNTFGLTSNQVVLNTGDNRTGDIFDWEGVNPGVDGTLVINVRRFYGTTTNIPSINYNNDWSSFAYGYGLEVLRVAETLIINPPTIGLQPQDTTMLLGASNALTTIAVGSSPLSYQWYYQTNATDTKSNALAGATNNNYSIPVAALSNAGYYTMVVTNRFGTNTTRTAHVTVIAVPPSFQTQPSNAIALVDSTTNFSVVAVGVQPITYQWFKGSLLPGDVALSGATSNVLSLVANETNAGPFYVVASNSIGVSTSLVALLTLSYTPISVVNQPTDQSANLGTTVNIGGLVVSGSRPHYQWFLGDVPILNATNSSLSFTNVTQAQIGYYQAMIYNPVSTNWSRSALLTVVRPTFSLLGSNQVWYFNDKGLDLGTTWTAVNYTNAATWSNGPGLLGFKVDTSETYQTTDSSITAIAGWGPIFGTFKTRMARANPAISTNDTTTYYLRTTFTNDGSWVAPGMTMTMSNLIDDGAIIYLNGTEIFRYGMPGGLVTYQTWAGVSTNATAWVVVPVPASLLVSGVNVFAVELHQINASSSDVDWLSLVTCNYAPPTSLSITSQPANVIIPEGQTAEFDVGVASSSQYVWAEYQWYQVINSNSTPIAGAKSSMLLLSNVADIVSEGYYYVTVSNPVSFVVSKMASLNVIVDSNPPSLFDADGSWSNVTTRAMEINPTNVLVTFSETVTPATATNPNNYVIKSAYGATLTVTQAVMISSTNVLLYTAQRRDLTNNYYVVVNNITDLAPRHNMILANSGIPVSRMFNIINWSADGMISGRMQAYDGVITDGTTDGLSADWLAYGTNWIYPTFYQTNYWVQRGLFAGFGEYYFSSGYPAMLGNLSVMNTELYGGPAFFGAWFTNNLSQSGMANLHFGFYVDDGAIFFLNGVEIGRGNVGVGSQGWDMSFPAPIYIDATNTFPTEVELDLANVSLLRPGANFFSVGVKPHTFRTDFPDQPLGAYQDLSMFADWGMQVRSDGFANGPLQIVQQPVPQIVQENTPLTFAIGALGATTFQWRTNGVSIPGATNGLLSVAKTPGSWNNYLFSVIVGNGFSNITSAAARLITTGDTNGPAIVSAYALTNTSSINVAFNESLDPVTSQYAGNYVITNSSGLSNNLSIVSATLLNDTNIVLDVATYIPGSWFVIVNNIKDATGAAYPIAPNSTVQVGLPVTGLLNVDNTNMIWKYNQDGVDLGTVWNDPGFDDSSWSNGLAALDVDNLLLGTPGNYTNSYILRNTLSGVDIRTHMLMYPLGTHNSDPTNRLLTTYIRGQFVPPVPIWGATMSYMHFVDGGAIFYLNNNIVGSFWMSTNSNNYTNLANLPSVGDASLQGPIIRAMPDLDVTNLWATEVHLSTNTDTSFDFGVNLAYYKPSRVIPAASTLNPPVLILPVNPASNVTATLNGSANPSSFAPSKVWFEWGPTNQFNTLSNLIVVTKGLTGLSYSNYAAGLSNLLPGATYACRLAISNSILGVVKSSNLVFTTLSAVSSMTLTTLPPSNVRLSSAQLNGAVSAPAATQGGAWFEYTTGGVTKTTLTNAFTLSAGTTNTLSVALSNLNPATAYTYRLLATNSTGSTNANTVAFNTSILPTNRVVAITNQVLTGQFTGTANAAYDVYGTNAFPIVNKVLSTTNWTWVTNATETPVGSGHYLWKDPQPTTNKIKVYRFK